MPLRAGCIYIGRGDADIVVSKRASGLIVAPVPAKADYPWHPSTDRLCPLRHGACVPAKQLGVGVLMTGMGNDGAAAMKLSLRANGGRTIAEAEETAVVWGMPGELVRAWAARRGWLRCPRLLSDCKEWFRAMPLVRKPKEPASTSGTPSGSVHWLLLRAPARMNGGQQRGPPRKCPVVPRHCLALCALKTILAFARRCLRAWPV